MKQRIIIINGKGGVGKDTFCSYAAQLFRTRNISSITPIIQIAQFAGWDGKKTFAARKLLSRLKEAFTEFNDLSFQYCLSQCKDFLNSNDELMFVHIREPEEIDRLKEALGSVCCTLLIRRPDIDQRYYGNRSDDAVEDYIYDYYFDNTVSLEALPQCIQKFFEKF